MRGDLSMTPSCGHDGCSGQPNGDGGFSAFMMGGDDEDGDPGDFSWVPLRIIQLVLLLWFLHWVREALRGG